MTDWNEFNRTVIDEFRQTGGKVGGQFEGAPMILITHTGAKSGNTYITPLVYTRDGDRYVVIASKGGAPKHPSGYGTWWPTPTSRSRSARALPGPGHRHRRRRAGSPLPGPGDIRRREIGGRHRTLAG